MATIPSNITLTDVGPDLVAGRMVDSNDVAVPAVFRLTKSLRNSDR